MTDDPGAEATVPPVPAPEAEAEPAPEAEAGSEAEPEAASEPAPDAETTPEAEPEPEAETETTLQEEFAELTPVLTSTMFGTRVQQISGLILLVVVVIALLVALKTLPTVPLAGAPMPTPTTSPSGAMPWQGLA